MDNIGLSTDSKPSRSLIPHPIPAQLSLKEAVICPDKAVQSSQIRPGVKRPMPGSNSPSYFYPDPSIKLGPGHPGLDSMESTEFSKRIKFQGNPNIQIYPSEEMIRDFNNSIATHTLDQNYLSPDNDQRLIHGANFISLGSELISDMPFTTNFDNTAVSTNSSNVELSSVMHPNSYPTFSYPSIGISPQHNKLLSSGLLNYSLVNSKPGILNQSYLNTIFDMNSSLDLKAKSHLESLIDISRYDQPELFHYIDNTQEHSRHSSSHDNESFTGELATAPGSPMYPAHLHWDLCQRPVSSPDLPTIDIPKHLIPEPIYQNNEAYINCSLAAQKSNLPISHSPYLPTTLMFNTFESNFNCPDKPFSEEVNLEKHFDFQGATTETNETIYPKLKPKPYTTKTIVHTGLCQSAISNLNMTQLAASSKNSKKSSANLASVLPKYIQVPLVTKSAWNCLYTVRKDGKPSTRATKMRLSEALTLIETQQVAAAFTNAGHSVPNVCPYPRCDTPYNSDFEFLRHHILTHNPDRPFECPICNVAFQRDQDLSRHKNIHLQIKAFTCPHCKKNFGRRDAQQRHTLKKTCISLVKPEENNELEKELEQPSNIP